MPYPMESGIEMIAADIAPERSPLIFAGSFLGSIIYSPFARGFINQPNHSVYHAPVHSQKMKKRVYQFTSN
jgi:hypothetical protein